MKLLLLIFLVGFVSSASIYDAADEVSEIDDLLLEQISELDYYHAGDDIKEELGKKLREAMDRILEKIKEAIEQGKSIRGDLLEKLKDLKDKMKKFNIDFGDKLKDLLQKVKDKAKDFLKKILDNLEDKEEMELAQADFNIKNIFKKLKKAILDKIDKEKLKEKVESLFGKGSELADQLMNLLKEKGEKGKKKLLDWIDKILGDDETEVEQRSIKDLWEKVKDYFKDLNIDLKEKFAKFGKWVKENYNKVLDKSKSKLDNIKAIAREFVKHAKDVSKEVGLEALDFLKPYKEDLGELWDQVKDAVKEIVGRKE